MPTDVNTGEAFGPLKASRFVMLTTFRKNGQGVGTPVSVYILDGKGYFTTWTTTGKVKRMRNNPHVTLAPCTQRGKVLGDAIDGVARQLDEPEMQKIRARTRSFWGSLWHLIYKIRRLDPVMFEISPATNPA